MYCGRFSTRNASNSGYDFHENFFRSTPLMVLVRTVVPTSFLLDVQGKTGFAGSTILSESSSTSTIAASKSSLEKESELDLLMTGNCGPISRETVRHRCLGVMILMSSVDWSQGETS